LYNDQPTNILTSCRPPRYAPPLSSLRGRRSA